MTDTAIEPSAATTGLFDGAALEDSTKVTTEEVAIDHRIEEKSTDIASDTGAPKVKPEFLPDNFWDANKGEANLEAMSKSWSDLRKQISQGKHKAPADGNYDTSSWGGDAAENPMASTLLGWAKENNLSQGQFDDLVGQLKTKAFEVMDGQNIDPQVEMQKLGPNGSALVNGMSDWARGLISKGTWSSDDWDEFKIMAGTARGVTMLSKLRETYEGRMPIETQPLDGTPSKDELYSMVNDKRYREDPTFRKKVERMFEQTIK
ncbi:MAG: hypothetical protein RL680_999 [Actinomycetota bacterium]|jgi:hypothetical protein